MRSVVAPAKVLQKVGRAIEAPAYALYANRLWRQISQAQVPRHLAIILDGNRRFTRRAGLASVRSGYAVGADRVLDVIGWSERAGVAAVTVWAVSVDNLLRPADQMDQLFAVLEEAIADLTKFGHYKGWRLRGIGRSDLLPSRLSQVLREAEAKTAAGSGIVVQLALGYGGREEIMDALQRWSLTEGVRGQPVEQALATISPQQLAGHLYGGDLPDPDLILRTSGELRLSGFLLWQSVYSEFYFTDVLWPNFREIDFLRALRSYQARQRRYGR